jgi:hypothetical protein
LSRSLGLATATTSAAFLPHLEQRILAASFTSVTDLPAIRTSASGSMWRDVPDGHKIGYHAVRPRCARRLHVRFFGPGAARMFYVLGRPAIGYSESLATPSLECSK